MARRAAAFTALGDAVGALCIVAMFAGCAIRYDSAGTTRVGIGLWGFGDPPGVDWNLDRPRRDIPDLPAMRPPDLPDRPAPFNTPRDANSDATMQDFPAERRSAIDDNRCRAVDCNALAHPAAASSRADSRRSGAAGR